MELAADMFGWAVLAFIGGGFVLMLVLVATGRGRPLDRRHQRSRDGGSDSDPWRHDRDTNGGDGGWSDGGGSDGGDGGGGD